MSVKFFGQFLVEENAITTVQLREALDLMDADYDRVGELAVNSGYMTTEDADRIHREQRYVNLPFGTIAVKQGFLSEEQLVDLLDEQRKTRLRIGDALVRLGYIEADAIERYFTRFNTEQDRLGYRTLPSDLQGHRLAEYLVGFFPKITYRVTGIRLKMVEGCLAAERHMQKHTTCVQVTGPEPILLTLSVDAEFGEKLLWGLLGGELEPEDDKPSYEDALGEYISIVAGNALMALQEEGVRGNIKPPTYDSGVPSTGYAFVLVCTYGKGTLVLSPGDESPAQES